MSISTIRNYPANSTYLKTPIENTSATKNKNYTNIMDKAIEAYKDELLTGLTKEEKEEIEKLIKAYRSKHKIETQADKDALVNYVKGLLKQFGYKGDYDACATTLCNTALNESNEKSPSFLTPQTAYSKERINALANNLFTKKCQS